MFNKVIFFTLLCIFPTSIVGQLPPGITLTPCTLTLFSALGDIMYMIPSKLETEESVDSFCDNNATDAMRTISSWLPKVQYACQNKTLFSVKFEEMVDEIKTYLSNCTCVTTLKSQLERLMACSKIAYGSEKELDALCQTDRIQYCTTLVTTSIQNVSRECGVDSSLLGMVNNTANKGLDYFNTVCSCRQIAWYYNDLEPCLDVPAATDHDAMKKYCSQQHCRNYASKYVAVAQQYCPTNKKVIDGAKDIMDRITDVMTKDCSCAVDMVDAPQLGKCMELPTNTTDMKVYCRQVIPCAQLAQDLILNVTKECRDNTLSAVSASRASNQILSQYTALCACPSGRMAYTNLMRRCGRQPPEDNFAAVDMYCSSQCPQLAANYTFVWNACAAKPTENLLPPFFSTNDAFDANGLVFDMTSQFNKTCHCDILATEISTYEHCADNTQSLETRCSKASDCTRSIDTFFDQVTKLCNSNPLMLSKVRRLRENIMDTMAICSCPELKDSFAEIQMCLKPMDDMDNVTAAREHCTANRDRCVGMASQFIADTMSKCPNVSLSMAYDVLDDVQNHYEYFCYCPEAATTFLATETCLELPALSDTADVYEYCKIATACRSQVEKYYLDVRSKCSRTSANAVRLLFEKMSSLSVGICSCVTSAPARWSGFHCTTNLTYEMIAPIGRCVATYSNSTLTSEYCASAQGCGDVNQAYQATMASVCPHDPVFENCRAAVSNVIAEQKHHMCRCPAEAQLFQQVYDCYQAIPDADDIMAVSQFCSFRRQRCLMDIQRYAQRVNVSCPDDVFAQMHADGLKEEITDRFAMYCDCPAVANDFVVLEDCARIPLASDTMGVDAFCFGYECFFQTRFIQQSIASNCPSVVSVKNAITHVTENMIQAFSVACGCTETYDLFYDMQECVDIPDTNNLNAVRKYCTAAPACEARALSYVSGTLRLCNQSKEALKFASTVIDYTQSVCECPLLASAIKEVERCFEFPPLKDTNEVISYCQISPFCQAKIETLSQNISTVCPQSYELVQMISDYKTHAAYFIPLACNCNETIPIFAQLESCFDIPHSQDEMDEFCSGLHQCESEIATLMNTSKQKCGRGPTQSIPREMSQALTMITKFYDMIVTSFCACNLARPEYNAFLKCAEGMNEMLFDDSKFEYICSPQCQASAKNYENAVVFSCGQDVAMEQVARIQRQEYSELVDPMCNCKPARNDPMTDVMYFRFFGYCEASKDACPRIGMCLSDTRSEAEYLTKLNCTSSVQSLMGAVRRLDSIKTEFCDCYNDPRSYQVVEDCFTMGVTDFANSLQNMKFMCSMNRTCVQRSLNLLSGIPNTKICQNASKEVTLMSTAISKSFQVACSCVDVHRPERIPAQIQQCLSMSRQDLCGNETVCRKAVESVQADIRVSCPDLFHSTPAWDVVLRVSTNIRKFCTMDCLNALSTLESIPTTCKTQFEVLGQVNDIDEVESSHITNFFAGSDACSNLVVKNIQYTHDCGLGDDGDMMFRQIAVVNAILQCGEKGVRSVIDLTETMSAAEQAMKMDDLVQVATFIPLLCNVSIPTCLMSLSAVGVTNSSDLLSMQDLYCQRYDRNSYCFQLATSSVVFVNEMAESDGNMFSAFSKASMDNSTWWSELCRTNCLTRMLTAYENAMGSGLLSLEVKDSYDQVVRMVCAKDPKTNKYCALQATSSVVDCLANDCDNTTLLSGCCSFTLGGVARAAGYTVSDAIIPSSTPCLAKSPVSITRKLKFQALYEIVDDDITLFTAMLRQDLQLSVAPAVVNNIVISQGDNGTLIVSFNISTTLDQSADPAECVKSMDARVTANDFVLVSTAKLYSAQTSGGVFGPASYAAPPFSTPTPTISAIAQNQTSAEESNGINLVAIVVPVVCGVLLLAGGTYFVKSRVINKREEDRELTLMEAEVTHSHYYKKTPNVGI